MQCTVKFFEVPVAKNMGGTSGQKVAVKMSAKDAAAVEKDSSRFAEMMAALMALPPERMDQSLPKVDWVPLEGGAKEWVPLIDLSNPDGEGANMIQMLLKAPKEGSAAPAMFHLKLKSGDATALTGKAAAQGSDSDVLVDSQSDALDQVRPEGVLDKAMVDELSRADLLSESSAALNGRRDPSMPAGAGAASKLSAEYLSQKGADDSGDKRLSDTDLGQKNTLQSQSDFAKIASQEIPPDASMDLRMAKSALSRTEHNGDGTIGSKIHTANGPSGAQAMPTGQGTGAQGVHADLMDGQPGSKRHGDERSARQHALAEIDADASIHGASQSPDGGNSGAPRADAVINDSARSFHAHLKGIENNATQSARSEAHLPSGEQELQTDVIRQIVQRMTFRADGRTSQMQIKLKPEYLGNMNMDIMTQNQQVMIRMTAENHKVKEIIEQNIHVLRTEMQQHGLQVQKIDVFVSQDQDAWKNGQQQAAFQQAQERGRQNNGQRGGRPTNPAVAAAPITENTVNPTRSKRSEVDFFA